jgi:hypothetical protein
MLNWVLNFIGIAIYFINRFANRRVKTAKFTFRYWLKDNFPELSSTLLINIALMLLLMQPETNINIDEIIKEYVPFGLELAVKPLFSFLLGLGLSSAFYSLFRKKVKK